MCHPPESNSESDEYDPDEDTGQDTTDSGTDDDDAGVARLKPSPKASTKGLKRVPGLAGTLKSGKSRKVASRTQESEDGNLGSAIDGLSTSKTPHRPLIELSSHASYR